MGGVLLSAFLKSDMCFVPQSIQFDRFKAGTPLQINMKLQNTAIWRGISFWDLHPPLGFSLVKTTMLGSGKQNFLNLLVSKSPAEALAELSKLVPPGRTQKMRRDA